MGFVDTLTSKLGGAADNIGGLLDGNYNKKTISGTYLDRIDQCQVLWYPWSANPDASISTTAAMAIPDNAISNSDSYDISNHIMSFSYSKGMSNGAGSFSLTLGNTVDWVKFMMPGQWLVIYLSPNGDLIMPSKNSGETAFGLNATGSVIPMNPKPNLPETIKANLKPQYLRAICQIQRVAVKSFTNSDGVVEVTYGITGKDFGVFLEEAELWFNALASAETTFQSFIKAQQDSGDLVKDMALHKIMSKFYDILLNAQSLPGFNMNVITDVLLTQFLIPSKMIDDLGLKFASAVAPKIFANLANIKEIYPTALIASNINMITSFRGHAWERLKEFSEPLIHELFTEISDAGLPKLFFRPIPWALNPNNYPNLKENIFTIKEMVLGGQSLLDKTDKLLNKSMGFVPNDRRTAHTLKVSPLEVESLDLGRDYHDRFNFFLVDGMRDSTILTSFLSLAKEKGKMPLLYPLRDIIDVKRIGYRPCNAKISMYQITNFNKDDPAAKDGADFIFLEGINHLLTDYHLQAKNFFSGTINMVGRNDVKLGKFLILNDTSDMKIENLNGFGKMIFYVEGYSDQFTINNDGTTSWSQTIQVTHGIEYSDVIQNSNYASKEPQVKLATFHGDTFSDSKSTLDKIKDTIANPLSLLGK